MKSWQHKAYQINVELDQHLTIHKWGEDFLRVKLPEDKSNHRFKPLSKAPIVPATGFRLINLGSVTPTRIGSIQDLKDYVNEPADKITITYYNSDRLAMMYYGLYPRDDYVDSGKLSIPDMRVNTGSFNDPMVMDPTLKLLDIHYVEGRDDPTRIHDTFAKALTDLITQHNIEVKADKGKLYWNDNGKWVKFFSTEAYNGHYYCYINFGIDYNSAHKYLKVDSRTKDKLAYGVPVDTSVVDRALESFAESYGLPLENSSFTEEESSELERLDKVHDDRDWVENGKRSYPSNNFANNIDGFEHEFDLLEKPKSNIFSFELEHSGLQFDYQPEEDDGYRPDHVKKSYAVYHPTKRHDQYQTGKITHIYRPLISDSGGDKTWADLDITNDVMSITVPQDFLDAATYPVTVDPTFGYTTAGGTSAATSNSTAQQYSLLAQTGFAAAIQSYWWYGTNIVEIAGTVYNNSTKALVDHSSNNTSNGSTAGWNAISAGGTTLSAISYDIGFQVLAGSGYTVTTFYYDTLTNGSGIASVTYATPPASTEPTLTLNNNRYSFFGSTVAVISGSASDTTTTSEKVTMNFVGYSFSVNVADTTTTSESVTNYPDENPQVGDNTITSENITLTIPTLFITTSDGTTTSESLTIYSDEDPTVSDTTVTSESVSVQILPTVSVSDTTVTSESITLQDQEGVYVTDSTSTSESITLLIPTLLIGVADSTTTSESIVMLGIIDIHMDPAHYLEGPGVKIV